MVSTQGAKRGHSDSPCTNITERKMTYSEKAFCIYLCLPQKAYKMEGIQCLSGAPSLFLKACKIGQMKLLPISAGMLPVQGSWDQALQPNHLPSYFWAQK